MQTIEHRADWIIRAARARTGNKDYSANSGVQQREFVSYLNDGQEHIFNRMLQTHSSLFQKQVYRGTESGEAAVDLPTDDIYLSHNIIAVMFSYNGNPVNYAPLQLRSVREEQSVNGYPSSYFLLEDEIILSPRPSNTVDNALKITYQKVVPSLDIRRAKVVDYASDSVDLSDTSPTAISEESVSDLTDGWVDYVCLVDQDGEQVATNLSVDSFDSSAVRLSFLRNFTSDETAALVAALDAGSVYLVFGKNASTHSRLPQVCERFLTEYTVLRAQMRDSNKESADTSPLLQAIEKDILDAVEDLEEDVHAITILDASMLNYSDELS